LRRTLLFPDMPSPLIGITTTRILGSSPSTSFQAVMTNYTDAVTSTGGLPVLIPTGMAGAALAELMARLDGVLLSGGGDVDPARYLQSLRAELREIDAERDSMEIALVRLAAEQQKPLLAICRGLQVVNVAQGGDLYQDLSAVFPSGADHDQPDGTEMDEVHVVEIDEGSLLRKIVGQPRLGTNSFHHQAAAQIGAGLRVVARAADGIVEALELEGHPFGLCVQWHPEKMPEHPVMRAVFTAFIDASRVG
jgi:putative glutamine amidotransferase